MHASLEWFWFSISQLCITRLLFTRFFSLSCAHLAEWPTHVMPVTCEIICASGAMWFYLGFCASCPVFVFKPPLLPCMYDSIRFGPIRYYSNQNPITLLGQHRSGKLHAELLLYSQSAAHPSTGRNQQVSTGNEASGRCSTIGPLDE